MEKKIIVEFRKKNVSRIRNFEQYFPDFSWFFTINCHVWMSEGLFFLNICLVFLMYAKMFPFLEMLLIQEIYEFLWKYPTPLLLLYHIGANWIFEIAFIFFWLVISCKCSFWIPPIYKTFYSERPLMTSHVFGPFLTYLPTLSYFIRCGHICKCKIKIIPNIFFGPILM